MNMEVREILSTINEAYIVHGDLNRVIREALPIHQANENAICFCKKLGEEAIEMIKSSNSVVIVCSDKLKFTDYWGKTIIQVSNPRLTYSRILIKYFYHQPEKIIHRQAIIDPRAQIGKGVSIGPGSVIGNCRIGDGSIIDANVNIASDMIIGSGVIIHVGVVVGAEAVAFERNISGELEWFPQIGRVIVQDNVEIGANSVVCRGALTDTVIGKGTKIDNLVRVGHGVTIGQDCIIVGGSVICGSVSIGERSWIGPLVCIRESVKVGNRVLIGAGSVVHKDINDGLVVSGSPARPIISSHKA